MGDVGRDQGDKPALVTQPPASEQCWFKCNTCGQLLSPSNPSRLYAEHLKNLVNGVGVCAGLRVGGKSKAAAASEKLQQRTLDQLYEGARHSIPPGAASASTSAAASAASTGSKRPRLDVNSVMQQFVASPSQIGRVQKYLSLFFFKNDVALNLVEDEDLIAAFGVLGVPLPNRKQLAGPIQGRYVSCRRHRSHGTA